MAFKKMCVCLYMYACVRIVCVHSRVAYVRLIALCRIRWGFVRFVGHFSRLVLHFVRFLQETTHGQ